MADQIRTGNSTDDSDWDALARSVAGEGSPQDDLAVKRWIDADPASAALVAALTEQFRAPPVVPPSPAEVEHALAAVKLRFGATSSAALPSHPSAFSLDSYRRRWLDARFRAAAAVLVVAGVGMLWRTASGPSSNSTQPRAVSSHYATAVGALDSLRLPDGSRVLLGPGSELTLANGFGERTREVSLRGEARFDVAHDGSRAFVVQTPAATFRDVGTVFSVHSDAGDGARVVVTSGSVAVQSMGSRRTATLQAGDRAIVAAEGGLRVERAGASSDDVAWTAGTLVFRDAPVAQVAADLRRWFGVVLLVDPALGGKTVTSTFQRGDAPREVGSVVAALLGGRLRMDGDTLRISGTASDMPK